MMHALQVLGDACPAGTHVCVMPCRYSGFGSTTYSYGSSYSNENSANAYMLMYRLVEPERNLKCVAKDMVREQILDIVQDHEGQV